MTLTKYTRCFSPALFCAAPTKFFYWALKHKTRHENYPLWFVSKIMKILKFQESNKKVILYYSLIKKLIPNFIAAPFALCSIVSGKFKSCCFLAPTVESTLNARISISRNARRVGDTSLNFDKSMLCIIKEVLELTLTYFF